MRQKNVRGIGMLLTLMAAFILSSPQLAFGLSFSVINESYWTSSNTDNPGYPPSPAGESGSQVNSLYGSSYSLQAVCVAYGIIYTTPFTDGRGAGASRQEFWDVTLQLEGEEGESAALYIDSKVWGEVDLEVFGLARAFTVDRSLLSITNAAGTSLLDYYYNFTEDEEGAALIVGEEFEDYINSLFLGNMIVGDPVWGSIRISGYQYATATAQAKSFMNGFASGDIASRFTFEVNALEAPLPPEPVPEPSTILLITAGISVFAGTRLRRTRS